MKNLFERIYEEIISFEPDSIESNHAVDSEVIKIVQSYKGRMNDEELQVLQDKFFDIGLYAQSQGFRLGMKYACVLLAEMFCDK